jgi:hypothetical protein
MRMKNTALLTGPYDWDPVLLPQAEFQSRLAQVRRVLTEQRVTALVVHGNSLEYGALAYLTGFVPKLGPAFALIEREGPNRLLVAGSVAMLPAAKRLTWVEDVRSIRDLKTSLADWLSKVTNTDDKAVGLWGEELMTLRVNIAIQAAIQPFGRIVELHPWLEQLRAEKSSCEREMLRRAGGILAVAGDSFLRAAGKGCGVRASALAAERAAYESGAQDTRILASRRDGGPPIAFDTPSDPVVNPIISCIAVRFAGYWAEGFITSVTSRGSLACAQRALSAMLAQARPGATFRELESFGGHNISPYKPHPFIANHGVNSIGLTLDEMTERETREGSELRIGGVYTLRAGAAGEGSDNAIVSALIAVDDSKTEILWSAISAATDCSLARDSQ